MQRYVIRFSGRVQGVGFRWTTCRVAKGLDVSGWVRNEPDGSVRCVAEGEPEELDRFVVAIQTAMDGSLRDTRIEPLAATGEFDGFVVR